MRDGCKPGGSSPTYPRYHKVYGAHSCKRPSLVWGREQESYSENLMDTHGHQEATTRKKIPGPGKLPGGVTLWLRGKGPLA